MARRTVDSIAAVAAQIQREAHSARAPATAVQRLMRRRYSLEIRAWDGRDVLALAHALSALGTDRWLAYELVAAHGSFPDLREKQIEELGRGMASWQEVDGFGRIISGPAWLHGQLSDAAVRRWARSPSLWWRRAALVSTVALNMQSQGGYGDTARSLDICRRLSGDREDMVVKALSWALRALAAWDSQAVKDYLVEHCGAVAARVQREVTNKLRTGLKTPRARRQPRRGAIPRGPCA